MHACAVGSGDEAAAAAMARIVAPAARRFAPDIILTSAGFDAHWRDPLEKLNYQSATYHALLAGLQGLADELCGAHVQQRSLPPACISLSTQRLADELFLHAEAFPPSARTPCMHSLGHSLLQVAQ